MIDFARIIVRAGDGGNGSGSFHHIKGKRHGKADGGNGGRGGDVYLEATADMKGLESFRFVREYHAHQGQPGLSRRRTGAQGADLVVKVPVGTVVALSSGSDYGQSDRNVLGPAVRFPRPTSSLHISLKQKHEFLDAAGARRESPTNVTQNVDLTEVGQRILVARAGEGGRGNVHLKDEFGRRPKVAEKGEKGEVVNLTLELKLIADVGLVGLPNAGKSTLLAALTSAQPQIGPYPFTTLEPNLGVLDSSQIKRFRESQASVNREPFIFNQVANLVIADIPGLIEGASEGRGLGDLFLRHIERTKILVHLIDASQLFAGENLWKVYQTVREELKSYSKQLVKKKEIIAVTKVDLVQKSQLSVIKSEFAKHRKKPFFISAQSGEGLVALVLEMRKKARN